MSQHTDFDTVFYDLKDKDDLKDIYKATTEEIAYQNLEKLQKKGESKYALAVILIEINKITVLPIFLKSTR